MTTALDIVTRSLRVLQCLGDSETPTNTESTDCLVSLNAMLKTWSAQSLMVFVIEQQVFTLTPNVASYTIGPSGVLNGQRPIELSGGSFLRFQGVDYQLEAIERDDYDSIRFKQTIGIPFRVFCDAGFPLSTLFFYYVPDKAYELHLNSYTPLPKFTSLTTDMSMPEEYEEALVFNLALRIAPEFNGTVTPQTQLIASETKSTIRGINKRDANVRNEIALMGRGKFNIFAGTGR